MKQFIDSRGHQRYRLRAGSEPTIVKVAAKFCIGVERISVHQVACGGDEPKIEAPLPSRRKVSTFADEVHLIVRVHDLPMDSARMDGLD